MSYHDTHIHRLGPNYHLIPVNQAKNAPEKNYQRDGFMRTDDGGGSGPNYWPNSMGGPGPDPAALEPRIPLDGDADRYPYSFGNYDFVQAGTLYSKVMTDQDRTNLVSNLVGHLGGAQKRIQLRQAAVFYKAASGIRRTRGPGIGPGPGRGEASGGHEPGGAGQGHGLTRVAHSGNV